MNSLFEKYLNNTISNSEFEEFKRYVNASTDEEIESALQQVWEKDKGDETDIEKLSQLKKVIDQKNRKEEWNNRYTFRRIMKVAAVIALPVMLISGYYFIKGMSEKPAGDMIVSVGKGEKVNIVLPDGTKVNMNAETNLSYGSNDFNQKHRSISMSGEAYFEVVKNEKIPFIIRTSDAEIEVLGTTFNLLTREDESSVEVDLISGSVSLKPNNSKEEVILHPDQRAVLNKRDGKISVFTSDHSESSAWRRGELVFNGASMKQVFKEIERSYDVIINENFSDTIMNDLFTGTFSTHNIDETMTILRMHYHFDYSVDGKKVTVRKHKSRI